MGLFKGCKSPRKVAQQVHADGPQASSPAAFSNTGQTPGAETSATRKLVGNAAFNDMDLFGEDSDASDDDAAIERYDRDDESDDDEVHQSRNVEALLSKMTPEEMFVKFDEDHSGMISTDEFIKMLPQLGIKLSDAKAIRIFDTCDKDGSGEIDLEEFKMAMFTVDPTTGNSLGFSPSSLLTPKDTFHLFDSNGSGQLDELEFADALEYFGFRVTDAKQERLFQKYDTDKSGFIEYSEFRAMWLECADVKHELASRGVDVPKYATRKTLMQILAKHLDDEERREEEAMAEAKWFHEWQLEKIRRKSLADKATLRAQDELAAALDAAGQVYVLGPGQHGQFNSEPAARDALLYDGYTHVSEIWQARVVPTYVPPDLKLKPPTIHQAPAATPSNYPLVKTRALTPDYIQRRKEKLAEAKAAATAAAASAVGENKLPFMRRRSENVTYDINHVSPPKLARQAWRAKPKERASVKTEDATSRETNEDLSEVLNQKFLEDRAFVRSLRFKDVHPMTNTGWLWGRQVVQAAISDNIAYAVTAPGQIYCWGGQNKWWKGLEHDEDEDVDVAVKSIDNEAEATRKEVERMRMLTSRSELIKMAAPRFAADAVALEVEAQKRKLEEKRLRDLHEDEQYEKHKRVVLYYDKWDPPPSFSTRIIYMQQVLLPKVDYNRVHKSILARGFHLDRATKQDLIELLGDCLLIESEMCTEEARRGIKQMDFFIQDTEELHAKKTKKVEEIPEKAILLDSYQPLKRELERREAEKAATAAQAKEHEAKLKEETYDASIERKRVQLEDMCPEYTPRSTSTVMELNGVTARGPPLHPPRGSSAVWKIAAGESFACAVTHNGSLYSWGVGISGRLGHGKSLEGMMNADSDHPSRVMELKSVFVQDVACAFDHSAALSADGQVYTWGSASTGKLGVGLLDDKFEQFAMHPMRVRFPGRKRLRQVSCGRAHTGAVSTDGELFVWGCANGGRLGLGEQVQDMVAVPTFVASLSRVSVAQVSCGNSHSALCTEIRSDVDGNVETLSGGDVYVCGSSGPLLQHTPTWSLVAKLRGTPVREVSCGFGHTAAATLAGELFTWGQNVQECTGHAAGRRVIDEPELVRAFHVAPYNLAIRKRARQSSVYNEQDAALAVDGNRSGPLHTCIHTQYDDHPWWEVDLGQPSVLERIKVWNRTDQPVDTSRRRDEFTRRLFPFWIMVSEVPFDDTMGRASLKAGRDHSNASAQFTEDHRLTEWVLPSTGTVGRYIRIQVKGKRYLHVAQVEVFGVYNAFNYVGHVSSVQCAKNVTLVVMRPLSSATSIHDHYIKAIQADPDNATILRQYEAYAKCFQLYGRGEGLTVEKCRLCRATRRCEVCEFYTSTPSNNLPLTTLGEKLGLAEAIDVIMHRELPRVAFEKQALTPATIQESITDKFAKVLSLSPKKLTLPLFRLSPSKKDSPVPPS
ncbi:hypothetical protein H310_00524 [Aphanomyces invadans]|uniref:EF-hand domain-containing protein n=1 Tax=Aphanomyces invadans TaxID=157072 RepID=A0A024UUX4_9STRA|nr:hypothetical protein H310_00524 [Aphanomyces invadans]ETW10154.1 hypothetical protein H310_00524 [Aphanomyces invadans]|eukprot:XP_008861565.1 hypothetical protein H310_00524 [Aphanomyces invadans]